MMNFVLRLNALWNVNTISFELTLTIFSAVKLLNTRCRCRCRRNFAFDTKTFPQYSPQCMPEASGHMLDYNGRLLALPSFRQSLVSFRILRYDICDRMYSTHYKHTNKSKSNYSMVCVCGMCFDFHAFTCTLMQTHRS